MTPVNYATARVHELPRPGHIATVTIRTPVSDPGHSGPRSRHHKDLSAQKLRQRSPDGADYIQWVSGSGRLGLATPSPGLFHEDFASNLPIRVGSAYKNRVNRHGFYYWQRSESHVWYESRLESECLVMLDFAGDVQRLSTQPFRILFADDVAPTRHDPDFFAVLTNGDRVVYDVKPLDRMTDKVRAQFAETERVCRSLGWHHVVLHAPNDTEIRNVEFLRAARHSRSHPPQDELTHVLQVFDGGRTIREGRSMLNRRHPALAMPHINHLLWHGHLSTDLSTPLGLDTTALTTLKGSPCCSS